MKNKRGKRDDPEKSTKPNLLFTSAVRPGTCISMGQVKHRQKVSQYG